MELKDIKVFIDPSSESYYKNILFDEQNEYYNRDNCLAPLIYLKKFLAEKGYEVNTADYLLNGGISGKINLYISLGVLKSYKKLAKRNDVILSSFFIFEPPVVAPKLYEKIPEIARHFRRVFVHSTGEEIKKYSKDVKNLFKFFWPQTENGIIEGLWNRRDRNFLTLINANKKPALRDRELYLERIKAVSYFGEFAEIDLYGFGWDKFIFYWPYIKNRKAIIKCWKGSVKSKYENLVKYNFAICFENMIFPGYITEKIFDCFFVGTIPIYLGAPDIEEYVPEECFIDMRNFKNYDELRKYLHSLKNSDIEGYRENARKFLSSEKYKPFTKEYFAEMILSIIMSDSQYQK